MIVLKPRFIRGEVVRIGDTIIAHHTEKGMRVSRTGTVAKREYEGTDRVYYTAEGGELFRWNPAHKSPRLTLVDELQPPQPTLPLEEWNPQA